jgi:2-polyprenyl-3-methyl-5-hydroxy-6-metoxy-1,4-benzoquinol methylase
MVNDGKWTPEIISRFWNYVGEQPYQQDLCFSKQVGKGILQFLIESRSLREGMATLDYGCGPGFLLQHLLSQGLICYGVDYSSKQIYLVNKNFSDIPSWRGASVAFYPPLPFPDASFDLIICVEVLEHLMPEMQEAIPLEIIRLLKPNGRALFTTPNNEDLDRNKVYCPFCETRFHKRQHLHSLNSSLMFSMLQSFGFNILFCESLDFYALQSRHFNITWKNWDIRFIVKTLRILKKQVMDVVSPKPFPYGRVFRIRSGCKPNAPHLCALVEKP